MSVFYNDNDSGAADWLENLIAERLIPDGVVDRRSITDIDPDELAGYVQCHFFAGIGGWPAAARLAGWPDERRLWSASCPCQPFSNAGERLGADDERHLWPDFFRLALAGRPPVIVGEQVSSALGYGWVDGVRSDLGGAGYAFRVVDVTAAAVDSPQIRQRLFWAAVRQDLLADADDGGRAAAAQGAGERQPRLAVPERGDDALGVADAADQGPDRLRQGLEGDGARGRGSCNGHALELGRGGALADGAGERGGQLEPLGGPQGRAAAAGDAAGERRGGLVDPEGVGRREGLAEPELRGRRRAAAVADFREFVDPDLADPGYGSLGDTDLDGERQPGGDVGEEWRWVSHPDARVRPGHGGSLVDAEGGAGGPGLRQAGAIGHRPVAADADGRRGDHLGGAPGAGPQGLEIGERDQGDPPRRPDAQRATGGDRRPIGSFWSGSGRLVCHDGKVRRIPEPAVPMLVNGVRGRVAVLRPGSDEPREISRVAAWKGFGNAIVAPLAAEWIGALMDVLPHTDDGALAPAPLED